MWVFMFVFWFFLISPNPKMGCPGVIIWIFSLKVRKPLPFIYLPLWKQHTDAQTLYLAFHTSGKKQGPDLFQTALTPKPPTSLRFPSVCAERFKVCGFVPLGVWSDAKCANVRKKQVRQSALSLGLMIKKTLQEINVLFVCRPDTVPAFCHSSCGNES